MARGKLVYLWAVHRGRSTVLLRCMANRENTKAYFEPLVSLIMGGADTLPNNPMVGLTYDMDESLTIDNLVKSIEGNLDAGYDVVVKDFALGLKYRDKLPLKDAKHIFVLRDPRLCVKSRMKVLRSMDPVYSNAIKSQPKFGNESDAFTALKTMYDLWRKEGYDVMLMESKDFAEKPHVSVKEMYDFCGFEYSDSVLDWENTGWFPDNWIVTKPAEQRQSKLGFCKGVMNSAGIKPSSEEDPESFPMHTMSKNVQKEFEIALKCYQNFRS